MRCQLCGNNIFEVMFEYTVYQPDDKELTVCGRCFILTDILKTLKELKDGKS